MRRQKSPPSKVDFVMFRLFAPDRSSARASPDGRP
jgi:hypothetical protein